MITAGKEKRKKEGEEREKSSDKRERRWEETRGERERVMADFKTLIKEEGRKVSVIKLLYWLALPGKQQSNMCDFRPEISATLVGFDVGTWALFETEHSLCGLQIRFVLP